MTNEYLSKSDQNLVHHLSCQAVRHTAYLNFCSGRMIKGLDHKNLLSTISLMWGSHCDLIDSQPHCQPSRCTIHVRLNTHITITVSVKMIIDN